MKPREKEDSTTASSSRDWVARNASWMLGWGLPTITLAVGAFTDTEMWIWAPMLTWMGVACLVNAGRCGRVHCHFTGPFFLVMALASLLFSLGVAYGLYLVLRERSAESIADVMTTSTPRAILFSALTTMCSFGTLAISSHLGTASMGQLLTISLALALVCTLVVLPCLLACRKRYFPYTRGSGT